MGSPTPDPLRRLRLEPPGVIATGEPLVVLAMAGLLVGDGSPQLDPASLRLAPGARAGIRLIAANGWRLVVGIGWWDPARGRARPGDVDAPGRQFRRLLAADVIRAGAGQRGADLVGSWLVGDTPIAIAAGRAAGCRTILVGREWRRASSLPRDVRPDAALPGLLAAAALIGPRPSTLRERDRFGVSGAWA